MADRHKEKPLSLRLGALRPWVEQRSAETGIPVRRVIIEAVEEAAASHPAATSAEHYPVWRNIGWLKDGDTEYAEIEVCGRCVPKHSHFRSREEVPEWPCRAS